MRVAIVLLLVAVTALAAADPRLSPSAPDGLRPGGTLGETLPSPVIAPAERDAPKATLAHPYLPPVVPHHVRDHQVDMNANRCLSCHGREQAERMQATPISPTHYVDRHGQQHDEVVGGRYFCLQCHVPQHRVETLVGNAFEPLGRPRFAPLVE